jgi:HemK-related putative methylase
MSHFVRALTRTWLTVRHQALGRRYNRLGLETVAGFSLLVLPQVFNGVLLRTGVFLAQAIASAVGPDQLMLDMGTGTGLGALFAARAGYRVTGVDINPEAVRCARLNALLNHLEDRVEIREGDLFAPVVGEQFDLVLFNPPFYRGVPRDVLDHAWRGEAVFERFAAGLRAALKPGGRALILLSTDGDAGMLAALTANGFTPQPVTQRDFGNEVLTVYAMDN